MDLGGRWRAIRASDELTRRLPDPGYDDRDWPEVTVPGQWCADAGLAGTDGPVLYRHRFVTAPPDAGRRAWLDLAGVFYQSDVWLDGSYLGDTEGYFAPHTFEVTDAVVRRDDHLLGVEVACTPPADLRSKRDLTGVFQHWDAIDPAFNPGGIWAPVTLTTTGPVRLATLRVLCREATEERATLDIRATLDADRARTVDIATTIAPAAGATAPAGPLATTTGTHNLSAGTNRVAWRLVVERPALWWPHALGDQPLHDLAVEVATDGARSDRRVVTTGLRQVRMRQFVMRVNGERLFLKGANLGPTRRALGEVTVGDVHRDIDLARGAGLDLLRVHAHVGHPELYAEADRTGMLLWQDLPLQWGYGRVRRQAVRQARQAVDLLGHHPAVALWCGHDEPTRPGRVPGPGPAPLQRTRAALSRPLPNWNRTALDGSLRRALERADGSRPVVAHAGVGPHPGGATDTHVTLGWERGDERDLERQLARWPVLARFVGSFGPAALPASDGFLQPADWPDLDWDHLRDAHGLDTGVFARREPPGAHASLEGWRRATQDYQAVVVRRHAEALRRLKYRPTGGFCHALLFDSQPAASRALVDHERVPKAALAALAAACAPVIVVADRPAAAYVPGARIELAVHAVSDLRRPLVDVEATAAVTWPGEVRRWRWAGGIPSDACVRIGRLAMTLPADAPPGALHLDVALRWTAGDALGTTADHSVASVTNHYESRVLTGSTHGSGRTLTSTDSKGKT